MVDIKQLNYEFKRERVKFPLERRKKVHKILIDCIENKVSLIPKDGTILASHAEDNPVDIHFHKLASEYVVELCEVILRLVTFSTYKQWKGVKDTFDFKFIIDTNTYLLLQQSDYLYELDLVLIKEVNGKMSRVRIAQGLTNYMISSANEYARMLVGEGKGE
ncbi:hypothetical protein [Paenibacillus tianjinensis]|uniref:Uncharacterized protein n=1 Tax=Paenibacillus tianjinensis TaxID=2810347 RepID=A0ABX7L7N7_9BACL|nr:hypothetical protein [Paenibacillus tianjinensis]QSF43261.1 hypothetical protein JRJ22_18515 [Paenibacillus tianjinensis]